MGENLLANKKRDLKCITGETDAAMMNNVIKAVAAYRCTSDWSAKSNQNADVFMKRQSERIGSVHFTRRAAT